MRTIVKVQMPVDRQKLAETGCAYYEKGAPILIYDREQEHIASVHDEALWAFMSSLCDGQGSMKSFMYATWNGREWEMDYDSLVPLQEW